MKPGGATTARWLFRRWIHNGNPCPDPRGIRQRENNRLRNFEPGEILVFSVANKPLPFRKKLNTVKNATYGSIGAALKQKQYKRYAIDDSQYLMAFELFDRAKETGYGKFTDIAVRFRSMIDYISRDLPDDTIVYLLHHSEITDSGKIKAKTVGKMLDNQLTVEGLFSVVLYCRSDGHRYHFETQTDGYTTAKSPKDMFNLLEIDNDLKMVDGAIREYWGLNTEK